MSSWRPKGMGWFRDRADMLNEQDNHILIYEAGADAMLEALKKRTVLRIPNEAIVHYQALTIGNNGCSLVIIPDDEERDNGRTDQ